MYSVKQAGAALNLSRSSIYVQMNNGSLRSVTVGARRLIPEAALIDFIENL
ncbi:MAG: helix-turn-helix domain-containing protein, partial [Mycobacterium sp.]